MLKDLRARIAKLQPPLVSVTPQNAGYKNGWHAGINQVLAMLDEPEPAITVKTIPMSERSQAAISRALRLGKEAMGGDDAEK